MRDGRLVGRTGGNDDDTRGRARSIGAGHALTVRRGGLLGRVGEDGATLTYVTSDGAGAAEIVGVELPVSRGIAGWTVMSGQPIAVRDVETDARFARDVAEATHYVPRSILAAPLFDDEGEAAGVLSVLDPRVDQSADWTLTVLGTLAALVGLLVEGGEGDAAATRLTALGRGCWPPRSRQLRP